MPLFRKYQRFWCLFAAGLLFIPFITHLVTKPEERSLVEGRILASTLSIPKRLSELFEFPKKTDAFLNDHYGLRTQIVFAHALIYYFLRSPIDSRIIYGKDGWLFYAGETNQTLQQIINDKPRIKDLLQFADFLSTVNMLLKKEGRTFVVAIPPNKESIYSNKLPSWLQNQTGPTEYDILLSALQKHKITVVDFRQIFREAAMKDPVYYLTDTHWNALGAILSYNAIVAAAGKKSWINNLKYTITPSKKTYHGDLTSLLHLSSYLNEETYQIVSIKSKKQTTFNDGIFKENVFKSYVTEGKDTGDTVLIFGDSFTYEYFKPLFVRHVKRLIWTHHRKCGFDWSFITRYQPDVVFYLPVERGIGCAPKIRPKGMAAQLFEQSSISALKIAGFRDAKKLKPIAQLNIAAHAGAEDTIILNSTGHDPRMWLPKFNINLAKKFIIKVELESPTETNLELYYRTESQKKLSNNQKVHQNLIKGKNIVYLIFPLTDEALYGQVRLDIGSAPGTYLVKSIEISPFNIIQDIIK